MVLNCEQIKKRRIIKNFTDSQFSDASYNLTVGRIIDMNNHVSELFTIKPQGMAYVVFQEEMNIPSDVIGFAHVKTALTKRGIMALNIGIIDSNYHGYISTLLINFGKEDYCIVQGDPALRVTFSEIQAPRRTNLLSQNNLTIDEYIKNTRKNITALDEKFLNLNSVEENIKKSLRQSLMKYAIFFAIGSFLLAAYFQFKNSSEKDLDRAIKKYETELNIVIENNELQKVKLNNVYNELESLRDSLSIVSNDSINNNK